MGIFQRLSSALGGEINKTAEEMDWARLDGVNHSADRFESLKYACDMVERHSKGKNSALVMGYVSACQSLVRDINVSDQQLISLYEELMSYRNVSALKAITPGMKNRDLLTREGYKNW